MTTQSKGTSWSPRSRNRNPEAPSIYVTAAETSIEQPSVATNCSRNVLLEESQNCCTIKNIVKCLYNKATISNFVTFVIMVTGIALYQVYKETDMDNWLNAFKLIRAFGLFGFAGGMTNWLAIRMMFDKIPFLVGSGILLDNFAEIRDNVKKTTMETYFDAGHLSHYVTQKTEIILNSLQLDESIREVIRSPAVQALISDKIDEVFSTPEGLVLGLVVSKDKVKQNIMPSIENAGKDIVPLVSQLIRNSEHLSEDKLREQIDRLISSKLVEMQPKNIIAVVKNMVETELGWVIVWGNVFGGILGALLEVVTVIKG